MRSSGERKGFTATVAIGLASLLLLGGFASAQSASAKPRLSAPVELAGGDGRWRLLIPMSLPLEVAGHRVNGKVRISRPGQGWSTNFWTYPHSGDLRLADQRKRFNYVLGVHAPRRIALPFVRDDRRKRVVLNLNYKLPGTERREKLKRIQKNLRRASRGTCETLPRISIRQPAKGYRKFAPPVCGDTIAWRVGEPPPGGSQQVVNSSTFGYRPREGASGADRMLLNGYFKGRLVTIQPVHFRVGQVAPSTVSVAAMGDSVTAGFGYFGSTGKQMSLSQLINCRPGATVFNDACSSNSTNRNSSVGSKPNYLQDYGLSRNISWAAQWANDYGITNYRNYAVTGSAPTDWLPGGQFDSTRQTIEQLNPDYILMTMGANPLLSDVLFGIDNMGCALESDLFGDFRDCVLAAFEAVNLDQNLNNLYTTLVNNTTSKLVVMQYHLAIPSTALAYSSAQLEAMTELLNEIIGDEAAQVSADRITVISPPRFDVGIDMEPLYPSEFSCSFLGYEVDGPSVQSTLTQDELEIDHPLSFCAGPAIGPPWIISGDTGIHPSAAGYLQMSSQLPAPGT